MVFQIPKRFKIPQIPQDKTVRLSFLKEVRDTLPDIPSDLIFLALKHLRSIERSKHYIVAMSFWHLGEHKLEAMPGEESEVMACQVCFAGAVMARHYKIARDLNVTTADFLPTVSAKFLALNCFRAMEIRRGLACMNLEQSYETLYRDHLDELRKLEKEHIHYHVDKVEFKNSMHRLAKLLRKCGL